jgi:NAD+ synthase (glutamine-hydrolysing)
MSGKAPANLRVVMAQADFLVGDIYANTHKVLKACELARDTQTADLIVFPELTLTGYPPEDLLFRPHFIEHVEAAVDYLRQQISGIAAIIGYPLKQQDALYNVAGVFQDGLVTVYRKQQLPNYSVFDEKRYFLAGDQACVVTIKDALVGVTVCEDAWESGPVQQAAAAGAQLLVNINASPFHTGKRKQREQLLGGLARETGIPMMYVNLVGGQDELVFDGGSFVVDRDGQLVQRAPACEAGSFAVDFALLDNRVTPLPGPCVPHEDEVAAIYRVLVSGVRDYIDNNRFSGAVLGLSGGVDSALTLAIAVDAIGAERVEAVMMPSRYTADMSLEDARAEAQALGVDYQEIPIEAPFSSFQAVLQETFKGMEPDTTEENIQARCRGIILMAISNKKRKILLTTGNKSEMSVGYATLYGDMAGGFAPIKDVPKLLVYRLCEYRNSLGRVIPQRVLERPPSAELAPDQKDADSLPDYAVLDPILERYIEQDQSVEEIVADGFDKATVARVAALVDRNEYKRRQAPPGVRITQRAFGRDRRYPLTSGYQNFQKGGFF